VSAFLASNDSVAGTTVYGVNNTGIYRIDTTNSTSTTVYTGTPFPITDAVVTAANAQCPNGLIYFARRDATGSVYSYNPATPAVPAVLLGAAGVGGGSGLIRMSCHPTTGVLYGMTNSTGTLYTINTTTGLATGAAMTLPGSTPPAASGSGDIGFNAAGTLYLVGTTGGGTTRLWIINTGTNVMSNVGSITGLEGTANGIAFSAAGTLFLSMTNITRLNTAPVTGGASSPVGSTGAMPAMTDLSSVEVPNPDLSVTKTDGRTTITPGDTLTYTLVVTNSSSHAVTGSFSDTLPASLGSITWTCSASVGSLCSAAAGSGSPISLSLTLASGGTATISVNATLSGTASGTLVNTASVALPWAFLTDATPANNSATDTDTIVTPSLVFLKTVAVTSDPVNGTTNPKNIPGADVLYTLRVTNTGAGSVTNNSLVIVDPIPVNTELFTGNLSGGAPYSFSDGSQPSGLTCSFVALNNLTDCIDFSNDNATTWIYIPNGSYDPAVTHIRFRPSGTMNGDAIVGSPSPSFDLGFRVRVN
jgi:uncharacterized repeat protein (TIGR01451 family)